MNDKKLALLMELYNEYWDADEIDIDLANQIVNQIPSLVKRIRDLQEEVVAWEEGRIEIEELD
ncbi:hypothetical protein [Bacillus xiapuensis]|uniref:Uncharacterized protein n=1 Tax=Bacillus xiapuensis TaxID=2014075 RepID=A0ABU6N888_9BACI|nr:hypothetical protein [Bacillus xiapuensis]